MPQNNDSLYEQMKKMAIKTFGCEENLIHFQV